MKFLIDMNLSPRWCEVLQRHNFVAQHWSNIGSANAPDQLLLEYARDNQFVLLTSDLDFGYLLALGRYQAPSVVLLRVLDDRPEVLETRLITVLACARRNSSSSQDFTFIKSNLKTSQPL
jgi:predicted nuclease of predicted toxin-antitoxin system